MDGVTRIVLRLTERDVDNARWLSNHLDVSCNAETVSIALSVTRLIVAEMARGRQVIIHSPEEGLAKRVVIPRLMPSKSIA